MMNTEPLRTRAGLVLGQPTTFVQQGRGAPIVFVHGNPTSSYLWRNIIPPLTAYGTCLAPDLPGMGGSAKQWPSGRNTYRFPDQRLFFYAFMEILAPDEPVVLVLHEYGSMLGFDWARQHPERVRAIVHMESITEPLAWSSWPMSSRQLVRDILDEDWKALEGNRVVEDMLPRGIIRRLTPPEFAHYRAPFVEKGEERRATWSLLADLPFTGASPYVRDAVDLYTSFLAETDIPKLLIVGNPGFILTGAPLARAQRWPNQVSVAVRGKHYLPEDSPDAIVAALIGFFDDFGITPPRSSLLARLTREN